jgi:hypothetical protein
LNDGPASDQSTLRAYGSLSVLVVASYFTTAIRDVYLVTLATTSPTVDQGVLSLSIGTAVAAALGLALLLLHSRGRSIRKFVFGLIAILATSIVASPLDPIWALAFLGGSAMALFHVAQVFAARENHLAKVGIASALSSLLTILVWLILGVKNPGAIVAGFSLGILLQCFVALVLGRKHWLSKITEPSSDLAKGEFGAILGIAIAAQMGWLLARIPYIGIGTGQLTSASFVLNLVLSVTIVIAAPTAILNLAGKGGIRETLLQKISSIFGILLFTISASGFVITKLVTLPKATLLIVEFTTAHGMVLALGTPAVTYLYMRVRKGVKDTRPTLKPATLVIGLLFQIVFIGFTWVTKVPPAFLGFGFVISQWVAMIHDKRSLQRQLFELPHFEQTS